MSGRDGKAERRHILIVDDDPWVRDTLREGFENAGFRVTEAADKAALLAAIAREFIDLITLDLGLGDTDGLDLAREIRGVINVPIIMITGRDMPIDRVKGLEYGADDYVTKPFLLAEVLLRVRNLLKRYPGAPPSASPDTESVAHLYAFESGVLDAKKRGFSTLDGTPSELTDTEIRLLALFLRNPFKILSRDEITRDLWSRNWSPEERVLDGHIARLRRKIEPGDTPKLIKSVRGVGYVFTGEVRVS